jgi:hypothetical protein
VRRHVCVCAPVRKECCEPCDFCLPDRPCRRWPGAPLQTYAVSGRGAAGRVGAFSSPMASKDAGPVFLNTTSHAKGCTRDAAAAIRRPTAPFHSKPRLEAALHPPFRYLNSDTISGFRAPSRARSRVWLEPETPCIECGALLAGVIPDGRGPSHIGPKLRANFFFALHTPVRSGV